MAALNNVDPCFPWIARENVVWNGQNTHFHHSSLKVSTLPYCPLLAPTFTHFLPLLATSYAAFPACQEETCIYLKKNCENWTERGREFCRHRLWSELPSATRLGGMLLVRADGTLFHFWADVNKDSAYLFALCRFPIFSQSK